MILPLRMRKNTHNTTSGLKMDPKFGFPVPIYLYVAEFCQKNAILTIFWSI